MQKNDFVRVLESIEMTDTTMYNKILYKLIFELLYGCSLRVSELCSIKTGDFETGKGFLRVHGKGAKTRITPVGAQALTLLKQFLIIRQAGTSILLVHENGKPVNARFVQRLTQKYLGSVTELTKKSPHILRHSSATHMLDNNADIIAIQKILGHENLSTTQIYTRVSIERLKSVYKKTHPKS
ncbi:MAG: tyrosine-type recombinase/integrase [Ignavibacteriales bacterium]|nr:tyrosine-type recombinase/integrase [Ignavibacteriales bacterium]